LAGYPHSHPAKEEEVGVSGTRDERDLRDDVDEKRRKQERLGVPPDAARSVAEDLASPGWRKPASDDVERDRIARAQEEDTLEESARESRDL
jgi:hypothetical protein